MLKLENVKNSTKIFTLDCSLQVKEGCITGLITTDNEEYNL